jgi:hypothetical protein
MFTPDGTRACVPPHTASTKALARAFRWRKLLETGDYGTIEELAAPEKINPSYVSRILRLTLLTPDIVDAILNGRQPLEVTLAVLMKPFPVSWQEQCSLVAASRDSNYPPNTSA